ncbi:sigma 54-interacting transcriptional regulator [Solidesulfovibrio sp.]|uniref:sigma 54-interacting transcriptional regulator n=1 Tax=Solidesulfovibrio sp. TaxID=2910990 RepID=UPI00261B3AE3|nr:sigma 54-interacting transcriptional regulator [Solidesulfovibrio sp.]
MPTIALLALNRRMHDTARELLRGENADVLLAEGLMEAAVAVARDLAGRGVEAVISRGATARCIQAALPDLSVVDISTSSLDLLTALHAASAQARRLAVVAFPPMTDGAAEIGRMLGLDVTVHELERQEDIATAVLWARAQGAQLVVGGYITDLVARRLGVPSLPVECSPQSLLAAVREARAIVHGRAVEKAKNSLLRAVLTSTDNGIVAVDGDGRVTVLSPVARKLLRCEEATAVGRPVAEVWPRSGLPQSLATGQGTVGEVERVGDREIVCTRTPVRVDGRTVGAVATIHDVRHIQRMEATVRRRVLASGHVAVARFEDVLGESPALRQAVAMARDYARTAATVLLHGETGTGKELFAQAIHNASPRRDGPFVAVNCAALPGQLLESELFGYEPGAFTGASQKGKAGLFELAHGGAIFLDEIAEMGLELQGKLLRVLQEKKVMRLGSDQMLPVDVRVVAATNKNLGRLMAEGAFRDDLFYRINVLRLPLPPLRRRREDIPGLARRFLDQAAERPGGHGLTPGAESALCRHDWPGNVRELQNLMARVAATHREYDVPESLVLALLDDAPAGAAPGREPRPGSAGEDRIRDALERTGGRVGAAAKLLGISRSTLWRRMRRA